MFIHGKLKVLSLGVGISSSTEPKPNMHKLAEHLGPDCLLFFTNEGPKVVAKYCEDYCESDHARSGFECTSTYVLPKGHLPQFTFTQDEMLRKLGVPVRLHLAGCFISLIICRFACTTATSSWTKTIPSQPLAKSSLLSRLMYCGCWISKWLNHAFHPSACGTKASSRRFEKSNKRGVLKKKQMC